MLSLQEALRGTPFRQLLDFSVGFPANLQSFRAQFGYMPSDTNYEMYEESVRICFWTS